MTITLVVSTEILSMKLHAAIHLLLIGMPTSDLFWTWRIFIPILKNKYSSCPMALQMEPHNNETLPKWLNIPQRLESSQANFKVKLHVWKEQGWHFDVTSVIHLTSFHAVSVEPVSFTKHQSTPDYWYDKTSLP